MLSRFIARSSHLGSLTLILTSISSSSVPTAISPPSFNLRPPISIFPPPRTLSTDSGSGRGNGNGDDDDRRPSYVPPSWTLTTDDDESSIFQSEESGLSGIADDAASAADGGGREEVELKGKEEEEGRDIFEAIDKELESKGGDRDEWETTEGYEPWTLGEEDKEVFESGEVEGMEGMEGLSAVDGDEPVTMEDNKKLEEEEQALTTVLKGPNRAFGDLITASGITEEMLDSLIALKDLEGVEGLPPLREIEDMRLEKNERKSPRYEMEQKKQEEIAKLHIRKVDEKGRAYGTGRRKCSIARVWIQPGDGKFIINDREFDAYFPNLDHRAGLLRPFSETKTLGLWDVRCTVKGGGISGQAGAIQLGVSRALQNWEPGLRPPLRAAGFLTRDPRVVERKKPGKAKARKSFQWVKR